MPMRTKITAFVEQQTSIEALLAWALVMLALSVFS